MKKSNKSVKTTQSQKTQTEKTAVKAKPATKMKKSNPEVEVTTTISQGLVQDKISKLATAYMSAMTGEMRFKKVKSMFKKLHKEIKSSVKKQKN